jgi:hypothetical protein
MDVHLKQKNYVFILITVQAIVCSVQCAVCSTLFHAVCGGTAVCGSVRRCGSVRDSVRQCAALWQCAAVSSSVAVRGSTVECIFSNEFKKYSYKLGIHNLTWKLKSVNSYTFK